jgi:hypothetical protein
MDPHLKNHLRAKFSASCQNDLAGLNKEGSGHPIQPGQGTFFIRNIPPIFRFRQGTFRNQLDYFGIVIIIVLPPLKGQDYVTH